VALPPPCRSCCGGSPRRSDWHWALSLFIVTDEGPLVIDVNPGRVEPMNALLAGVDLVRLRLDRASGAHPQAAAGSSGVRFWQLVLTVLGAAREQGTRRAVIRVRGSGPRARPSMPGEIEELTN
jgi:hypothetical protein